MTQRLFQLLILPLLLSPVILSATGCKSDDQKLKQLVMPSSEARAAALAFKHDFPEARVFFSQNTGKVLWIDGGGSALGQGDSQTPAQAIQIVHRFFSRYPKLFRISNPTTSLANAEGGFSVGNGAKPLTSLRFVQIQAGAPISGLSGTALFDGAGRLLALRTHLIADEDFESGSGDASGVTARTAPSIAAPLPGARRAWRLSVDPTQASPLPGRYQLIDERIERNGIEVRRILRDPRTGQVLESIDVTPSELTTAPSGWTSATPTEAAAHDSLGNLLSIASTHFGGALILGFHLDGVHADGKAATVADVGTLTNRSRVPTEPLATLASGWTTEPAFDPDLGAATTLAAHLHTTLLWFYRELGWASWNGRGGAMYTAVRGHRFSTKPELNAWGTGGLILIGDGVSKTGQPLSDALDIVAHEFTHSLIEATANFSYYSEAGALNESLSDFFGKAVQGFPDMIEGSQAGVHFRDLADPEACMTPDGTDCSQPGHYSRFEVRELIDDGGGVHTNSGIVNRALTQVVLQRNSATPLAQLVLDAIVFAGFDPDSRLEDFAAGLTAYCFALERAQALQSGHVGLCPQLEASFTETELLGKAI